MKNFTKTNSMTPSYPITPDVKEKMQLIDIPTIDNYDQFERAREKAWSNNAEACPCCGKELKSDKYYIHSAYGGSAYIPFDDKQYNDTWQMTVGSECRKKFPPGYVFERSE